MFSKVYITTAIDYANDVIHLGHAYQKILADILARYWRDKGKKVFFLIGADEHGANIAKEAEKQGLSPQDLVHKIAILDKEQWSSLNISYDRFIETTDEDHLKTVEKFWHKIKEKGDIYQKEFSGLYCLGCESFKTSREIVDNYCPLHRTKKIISVSEKNYFFQWSKYENFLKEFFSKNKQFVKPESRYQEILSFLNEGLEDISISRQSVFWGIPVPEDKNQTIYVWFEALMSYFTGAFVNGFWDKDSYIIHILGKDNLRWHALLWPAMLYSAGYRLPNLIYTHGFLSFNGEKLSKSTGNIIRPKELVKDFGEDGVRYFLAKYGPLKEDADISLSKLKNVYNAELANNLGNLIGRISKLASQNNLSFPKIEKISFSRETSQLIEEFKIDICLFKIFQKIDKLNKYLEDKHPWTEKGEEVKKIISPCLRELRQICFDLKPFMPNSMSKALQYLGDEKIKFNPPLFPRL